MESDIDRLIWVASAVMQTLHQTVVVHRELILKMKLWIHLWIWSWSLGSDWKIEMVVPSSRVSGLSLRDTVRRTAAPLHQKQPVEVVWPLWWGRLLDTSRFKGFPGMSNTEETSGRLRLHCRDSHQAWKMFLHNSPPGGARECGWGPPQHRPNGVKRMDITANCFCWKTWPRGRYLYQQILILLPGFAGSGTPDICRGGWEMYPCALTHFWVAFTSWFQTEQTTDRSSFKQHFWLGFI